ncbi:class I SAM-dependent methyltransferase [Curtobacterium flaccumfaciens]|uniref:class I SAM-dependent methyltransferase n=1 Tax=Curtobacterium flaccumfaciens TaxID=2035 RepID=UPI001366E3C6|nr:class I SAM-dependent methyltransferase [Curtobacterium flaccumfaciens]MBT1667415.1 methyltransferase domain-containing protein [Curtobacterium flaccumfaciens pv. flaccumfaciens]QHN63238.1 class I SAM-dependent methyltransferase [Curtobacterium flaccumfaciens pv. flaccumfaciens]
MHTHDDGSATGAATDANDATAAPSAREWWESRYAERDGIWSGRVNAVLASVTWGLPVGRALDLGCGEGGDAVWLAEQGWDVTGIDLSVTALQRGSRAAVAAGVQERTAFVAADLARWDTAARFDLVTASFLQSWPVEIPRADILRRAAGFVAAGGHLLVTAHAAPPHDDLPPELREYRFPAPADDLAALQLDDRWDVLVAEVRPRTATTPEGDPHEVLDSVVLARLTRG